MSKLFTLFIIYFICSVGISYGQKDYWSVVFPGYDLNNQKSTIAPDQTLNMALNNLTTGQPNKFISLDKNGLLIYQQLTNEMALCNFKDSSGNRYLVTYATPVLRIQKYNNQNMLLWDGPITLTNAVNPAYLFNDEMVSATQYLFTSTGKLTIAGSFKQDTTSGWSYESFDVLFIDTASGALVNQYYQDQIYEANHIDLQEDNNGNINMLYYGEYNEPGWISKITQSGTLLSSAVLGDGIGQGHFQSVKMTPGYIYSLIADTSYNLMTLKLGATLLDTVYYQVAIANSNLDFGDFFDADDSSYYISRSANSSFWKFDNNGNLACSTTSSLSSGYKVCKQGNKCYVAINSLVMSDSLCGFANASPNFNAITFQLAVGLLGPNGMPLYNFAGKDIVYVVSQTQLTHILGVIGIMDAVQPDFSGRVYFDINNNCSPDSAEPGLPNQLVKIDPLGNYMFTDVNGNFQNRLDTGSYVLTTLPVNNTLTFCPASVSLNISDTTILNSGNNMAVQDQAGNLQDLAITINQSSCMPGFFTDVFLTINNTEPLAASGYVKLSMQANLFSFLSSSTMPDSVSGNDYYWHVNNLTMFSPVSFYVEFRVDSAAILGTVFTNSAQVVNLTGESYLLNNTDNFSSTVIGSYDPNNKNVVPLGLGTNGMISPADTILNYKIQFQNTGSYQAYTVKVVDTIDVSTLDISTFKFRSSSHACKVSIRGNNVLAFTFNDINLPDSTSNEPLSHGFINYSIQTKHNLPLTTQIKNQAHIYFDCNLPVVTNQTVNTIDAVGLNENNINMSVYLYPNPASEQLTIIANPGLPKIKLTIFEIQGRKIEEKTVLLNNGKAIFPITDLVSGYYLLKLETLEFITTKPFIKL